MEDGVGGGLVPLRVSAGRMEEQATHLHERLGELARQAEAASDAGLSVFDTAYAGSDKHDSHESDQKNDEALRERAELINAAEPRKAALVGEAAALRDALALQQREVIALEKEQAAAATVSVADAQRRADASKETENLVGVTDMTQEEVHAAVEEEETLARRNGGISAWYRATLANLELIGGVRISHRLIFGTAGGGEVEGLELMVDLGSAQIMEVTVSAMDGSLRSAQLCLCQESENGGAGITPSELAELKTTADALPAPGNLRMLVREALNRSRYAVLRDEHVRVMRKRYLVGYRASSRELAITMPVGIVVSVRLHADYPRVSSIVLSIA